ncbi:hypothetical protein [Bremerella sp.]|uniref:hypothetical protein n=1 Tax=Bremerella sp. TaxID=2795602 RepID=UPI00391DBCEF
MSILGNSIYPENFKPMSLDPKDLSTLFTHVDVSSNPSPMQQTIHTEETNALLKRMLELQERQTLLMEEMLQQQVHTQKQRSAELNAWRKAHPELAEKCRLAAEALSKVHADFLGTLANEVDDSADDMIDSEFMLNEFVDRFGPRIAHLNGVLQMLAQLGAPAQATKTNSP